jgi:tRNA-2-methylthio-N6-dimethylallyladenosine synthase
VVVLNTCCIRENADNKLYGNLGHLKRWKEAKEGRQIVVSGCLAQKDRELVRQKAPWVDVVLGTHNVHRAGELLQHAGAHGPITEILDEAVHRRPRAVPVALPARRETSYNAWVTIQIGCDNSCAFCIVPAVRGAEISRPFDDVVAEVHDLAVQGVTEVTLLGQNVNSYGRDLQLAARRGGDGEAKLRPLFADLITATVGSARHPPRAVHQPAPQGHAARDVRRDGRVAHRCASTCTTRCSRGSDRVLSLMHRGYTAERYLERLAQARQAIPDLAVSTDIIVGFPGETDDDFERTLEVAAAAEYDYAYTFIFSPREGTEAATMVEQFVDPAVVSERFERLRVVVERSAIAKHRLASVASRRCSSRDPRKRTRRSSPAAPGRTSWSTSRRRTRCAPAPTPRSRSPVPRRTT